MFPSNDLEGSWTASHVSHEQMEMSVQTAREFTWKALEKSCHLPVSETNISVRSCSVLA